jgi:signal transduction histidine kinase
MESFTSAAFFAWDEANRKGDAGELRGELLQTLTALAMDAGWARAHLDDARGLDGKLGEMLELLRGAVASTESIAAGLRPLMLEPGGLVPAIECLAREFERRTGVACELQLDHEVQAEEPWAMSVFRIVQDWLRCMDPEGAHRVRIRLVLRQHEVVLQVQDDRAGAQGQCMRQARALVAERARLLGGTLGLTGVPGLGTQLEARIPREPLLAS